VQPWDQTQVANIEKSDSGCRSRLNPSNDGKLCEIPIPPLTEERRKQLAKQVHEIAEDIARQFATSAATRRQAEENAEGQIKFPRMPNATDWTRCKKIDRHIHLEIDESLKVQKNMRS